MLCIVFHIFSNQRLSFPTDHRLSLRQLINKQQQQTQTKPNQNKTDNRNNNDRSTQTKRTLLAFRQLELIQLFIV